MPRLAAIERPFGMNVGAPGDRAGQLVAVRATLEALTRIKSAGEVVHLPLGCDKSADSFDLHPPETPPITKYLMRHPWALPRFVKRDPPKRP